MGSVLPKTLDEINLPYCTYTDPEIAQVGLNENQLKEKNIEFEIYSKGLEHNDRALCESKKGIYKVYCKKGTDEILGATLIGGPAGDIISCVSISMHNNIGLIKMGACVYPYPTYAEIFRQMGD